MIDSFGELSLSETAGAVGAVVSIWTSVLPTASTLPTLSYARNLTVVVELIVIAPE